MQFDAALFGTEAVVLQGFLQPVLAKVICQASTSPEIWMRSLFWQIRSTSLAIRIATG